MIDSVGYMVDGAVGAYEDGVPRMVTTPWFDYEIPMTEAAELGTKKVMDEHCTIGLVVTTDGSVTDIPRQDYLEAERRAITDMKATGKPFLVIINCKDPQAAQAKAVKEYLDSTYAIDSAIADCQAMDNDDINLLVQKLLYAFPMKELRVYHPRWMDSLEQNHPVKEGLITALLECAKEISTLVTVESALSKLRQIDQIQDFSLQDIDLSTGTVTCCIRFPESLFYGILSSKTNLTIENDAQLLSHLTQLSEIKHEYDRIADALSSVKATGYGIVMPGAEEMKLETPEVIKKNNAYGVKLKAGAQSIHMIRVDIDTEINPMVGDEQQSKDLISYLCSEDPDKLWQSNIFGKSVYTLIREGLTSKLLRTPEEVRAKFQGTLTKIVNEGASGLICLIL
jgi:stage IV sporulation protein A